MLPTGAADLLTAALVQRVVNHRKNLNSRGNQRFHQHSKEPIGYPFGAPLSFVQESVDSGEVPGFMEPHGQNNFADRVRPHREDPTDQQRRENAIARSAEAHLQRNIVNLNGFGIHFFNLAFPLSHLCFVKPMCAERLLLQALSD